MSKILFIFAIALLVCGVGFSVALDHRRKKIFDDRCTWYLVTAAASFIVSIVLCVLMLIFTIFGIL